MAEQRWQRANKWIGAEFEDSLVMVDIDIGTYVGLNDTAAAVWEAIEQPVTRDDIVASVRTRYDIGVDECAAAVTATLERFREIGLAAAV